MQKRREASETREAQKLPFVFFGSFVNAEKKVAQANKIDKKTTIFVLIRQSLNNLVQMFIERDISFSLKKAASQFPVVFLTGPRQSGKTSLLRHDFPDYQYANLEDPELRSWAIEQPKDFLLHHSSPLIIDEAQYAPNLFSYIQILIDENQKPGMFLLSGSQNFLLMERISQSLAGRSAILSLYPLSYNEISHIQAESKTNQIILDGFYPRLFQTVKDSSLFYKSYVSTYVERDIRQLSNIGQLNDFIRFMKLCAGRSGQLLNLSSLATETGIAYNTCKAWLSILITGYIIQLVQPYHKNFSKKIVKTPKLYFTDPGLLCYLLGINTVDTLAIHPLRGQIFETMIFDELLKSVSNFGLQENISFWKDNHGTEIDFLIGESSNAKAIEVKSGMNFQPDYLKNLKKYRSYNPEINDMSLIYDGTIERMIDAIHLRNWRDFKL
jgi:predicted AAA+ superfamily ATPase